MAKWTLGPTPSDAFYSIHFVDTPTTPISRISIIDNTFTDADGSEKLCTQMGRYPCDGSFTNATYKVQAVMPPCSSDITQWCIDDLQIYKDETSPTKTDAQFIRNTIGPNFAGDSKSGLPPGGTISLWRAPGQINSGGTDTYAVYITLKGSISPTGTFSIRTFQASITPYKENPSPYMPNLTTVEAIRPEVTGSQKTAIFDNLLGLCAWIESGICASKEDFATGSRASVSLRVGNALSGWLMGRIARPEIEIHNISPTQKLLTVDAEPITTPVYFLWLPKSEQSSQLLQLFHVSKFALEAGGSFGIEPLANDWRLAEAAKAGAALVGDSSAASQTLWSFATTNSGSGSRCLTDNSQLLGVVSTNSTIYEGTAPNFIGDSLEYKVYSLHFAEGIVFRGTYDLLMRSETARCLYGFSNAPINANVMITSSDGLNQVSTNIISEKSGWLHVGAYGFTFSSPTVKVRLTQSANTSVADKAAAEKAAAEKAVAEKAVAEKAVAEKAAAEKAAAERAAAEKSAVKNKAVAKNSSIVCLRGKIRKVVTGFSPKCPVGYARKDK